MSTDYRDYFDARITRELETNDSSYGAAKFEELQRASQEKVASLQELRRQRERIEAANRKSLVGQLGLDRDSFVGEAVDVGVATAAGVGNYIGTVGNAAATLAGNAKAGQAFQDAANLDEYVSTNDDETKVSGLHRRAGDVGISALKGAIAVPEMAVGLASMVSGGKAGKYLEEAGFRPEEAKRFLDTLRTHEQQAASQKVNGAEGFWNTMAEIADNPSVVPHALMESLFPMFAGGLAGRGLMALGARSVSSAAGGVGPALPGVLARTVGEKAASSLAAAAGEGMVMAGSAAEQIRQQTKDGRLSLKQALSAAGTGLMGAGVARVSGAASKRLGLGDVEEALVEGSLGKSQLGAVTRTVGSGSFEGGEEALQSSGEQVLQNVALDKALTEGVGNAAAMGLVTGAAMGAPMGLAEDARVKAEKKVVEANQQKVVEDAIASGDVSALLDKSKPAVYAPERAVAALVSIAKKADTTPEQKQTSLDQANEIVTGLAKDRLSLETMLEMNTPEGVQKQIADAKAQLADPANAANAEDLQLTVAELEASLVGMADPKKVAAKQKQFTALLEKVDKQLAKANEAMGALDLEVSKDTDIEALVATASQAPEATGDPAVDTQAQEQVAKAAVRVFAMAMRNPEKVSAEAALALADNPNNGLSDAQRNHLRIFNEARIAANAVRALGDVSQEVYDGSADNLGLANYRSDIPKALANGKRKQADSLLEKLTGFSLSHQGKAAAVAQAAAVYAKSGKANVPVGVRKTDKGWEVGAPFATEEERAANGGLNVSGNSKKLITAINQEATAIDKTLAEMQSAYSLQFNKGTKNVTNQPQQAGTVAQKEASPASTAQAKAPAAVSDATEGVVPGSVPGNAGGSTTTGSGQQEQVPGVITGPKEAPVDTAPDKLPWESDAEFAERQAAAPRVSESTVTIPDAVKSMSDAALNDALSAEMDKPGYQTSTKFIQLDAEMTSRESLAAKEQEPLTSEETQESSATVVEDTVEGSKESKDSITENTSTDQTTTPEESSEKTSEDADVEVQSAGVDALAETSSEVPASKGVLSILGRVSAAGASFAERVANNTLIGDFFSQKGNANARAKKALVVKADFLSAWAKDDSLVDQYLAIDEGVELFDQQRAALRDMKSKLIAWSGTLKQNLVWDEKTPDRFRTQDMAQFLLYQTEAGIDMDENVKTAMAYAAYQWAALKASGPRDHTRDEVLGMHGHDKGSYISPEGYKALRRMEGFEERVISELGKAAIRALGLVASKDAPKDLMPKLETALGIHTLAMMEKEGLIRRISITSATVQAYFVEGTNSSQDAEADNDQEGTVDAAAAAAKKRAELAQTTYISLFRNNDQLATLSKPLQDIKDANKGSYDVVNKVFGEEDAPRFASTKPMKFVQKFAKKTQQRISKMQRRVVQRTMDTPHTAIPEMLAVAQAMGRDAVLKMAGWQSLDGGPYHDANIFAIDAQNQNLERQYDLMMEMLNNPANPDGFETEFFVQQEVWRNFRAGFTTQSLNQQTSKIHRNMFARPSWKTVIDLDNQDLVDTFKVAVAQAMGINIDRQLNEKTRTLLDDKLTGDSKIMAAIEAIRRTVDSDEGVSFTDEEIKLVTEVAAGAEGMQSLQAMVAYAKYENARLRKEANPNEKVSVEITMLVGADGKTSGPMLTHLALGAASSVKELYKTLQRGGMYTSEEGSAKHYSEWYSRPGSKDLYENLTSEALQVADKFVTTLDVIRKLHKDKEHKQAFKLFTFDQWGAFVTLAKELSTEEGKVTSAGRNMSKTPITAFGFGSALAKAVSGMENKFIDGLYSMIQDMAQNKKEAPEVQEFINAVNTLISQGNYKAPTLPLYSVEELLKFEFRKNQEEALRKAFRTLIGEPTKAAMKTEFAVFIDRRTRLNQTIQAAFVTYKTVTDAARIAEMNRLMDAGEIEFFIGEKGRSKGERIPLHDMNQEQEAAFLAKFKDLLPVVHTDYSLAENDSEGGLFMAKTKNAPNTTPMYASKVQLGTGIVNSQQKKSNHLSSAPMTLQEQDPGVAGTAYMIHSLDSAGIHKGMDAVPESMNVHDEIGTGVGLIGKAAAAINKGITESLLDYSPAEQAFATFSRLVLETARLVKEGTVPQGAVFTLFDKWVDVVLRADPESEVTKEDSGTTLLALAFRNAIASDKIRLGAIAEMAVMDQYPWEGGSFTVTEAIQDKARLQLKNLPTAPSAELAEAMNYLETMVQDDAFNVPAENAGWATPETEVVLDDGYTFGAVDNPLSHIPSYKALSMADYYSQDSADNPLDADTQGRLSLLVESLVGHSGSLMDNLRRTFTADALPGMVQLIADLYKRTVPDVWGTLGESAFMSDTRLINAFKEKPVMTGQEALVLAYSVIGTYETPEMKEFYGKLGGRLKALLPKNLTVTYITKDTKPFEVEPIPGQRMAMSNARGWFVPSSAGHIYILGAEFEGSGITPELLIHEILHSVLADAIENAEPGSDAEALVKDLEALLKKAQEFVAAMPKEKQGRFASAVQDVHELVAYGMSRKDFQTEVLDQISMESSTQNNKLVSGAKAFMDALVGFFFKGKNKESREAASSGMTVLIQNVSGLFKAAEETQQRAMSRSYGMSSAGNVNADAFTTQDIHQALDDGKVSASFQEHLGDVLGTVVQKLHGPFGSFKKAMEKSRAGTPMDTWLKALDTGAAPFASSLLKAGLPISQQEAFVMEQVEATVAAALEHTSTTATTAYRELSRLFLEVASKTEPKDFYKGDWATASQAEKDEAQATFDAIFNVTLTQGNRSDYLSRFAAFGLAHEGFNQVLKKATERDTRRIMDGKTFAERLQNVFDKILGMFNRAITRTYSGQHADAKLNLLVSQLVDIEAKRKHTLAQEAKKSNDPGLIDKTMEGAGEMLKDAAMWALDTKIVKDSNNNAVRLGRSIVSVVVQNKMIQYMDNMTKLRDMTYAGKPGVAAGLLNNVKGPKQMVEFLVRMTKKNEKQRKHIMTNVSKFVRGAFKDGGKGLTKESKKAISNVFLRSGAYALLNRMTVLELGNLLGDKAATNKAIADVEAELSVFGKPSQYFMYQANGLAYYKATGKTNVELLMMNAHNIAQMLGTPVQGRLNASDAAKAEQLIEQLVALYAIRYTSGADIQNAREVIRDELTRSDGGNGVEFVLRMHEHQQQEALERVFKGNKTLMIHGYTPEIYNPHIEVVAASLKEGEELKYRGYEMVHALSHDPADPDIKKEALYVLRDGGLNRFASGALSLTGLSAKGDTKHSGYLNTNNYYGGFNASTNASFMAGKQQAIADSFKPGPVPDLSKSKKVFAAPLLNEKGDIVNWRYLMTDKTKDTILERTNDFDQILGTLAGATYDKETSKEQNGNVITALKEMYDAEYGSQSYSYVAISAKSDDPEMVEIWRMLSDDAKAQVKEIFGEAVIYVRKDSLDAIFGYRKLSLADAFKKDPVARGMMEKAMVAAVEAMLSFHYRMKGKDWDEAEKYAKRAAHVVTKSERIWQELVHEVKDIIVVKTGTVMVGNIWSNLSMLYLKGVPLMDIARHHMTAFRGAVAYKKDTEQLEHLRYLLATKQAGTYKGGEQQIHRDMARLQDAIDRSPVKELMDAGLMPTIVEDVAADDDQYSYKSALTRKVDALLPAKAGLVMKAARHVYMAHDTPQYKFLAQTTQLSDFVARYTLYQHQTTRKKAPLSKQAAISEASETFVNYDMPMQRNLQYLDDMGLTPFMKYFLNIQRVLAKTMRENPGRVLSMISMGQFLDLGPIVLESSAVTRVGNNPLQWGALKLPGSLDDLATVDAVMAILK